MLNFTTLKNRSARGTLTAIAWFLAGCLLTPAAAEAAEYYVAPDGSSTNDGSVSRPLDLATALSASSPARPGDTIWLRDGRYLGTFVSDLEGSTTSPIVVRQYPGERAVIDAVTGNRNTPALYVRGSDTWYWGFEVTDSNPVRKVTGGYNPPRATSVWVLGPRTKFINMIVHDGEQGFGFWNPAVDAELYGNLIYNVGFDSDDRGHGHSIYVQNTSGTKRIVDNILFNGFSFGIHAYTEGGRIDYVHMKGNTIFNHGVLSAASGAKANLYMGGGDDADFPVIQDNYLYYSPFESDGRNIDLRPSCNSGTVTGNYAAGGRVSIYCVGTTVTGNVFAGEVEVDSAYPSNTYTATKPTAPKVFVRPNTYEPGARANITVYNWDRQAYVLVNLSAAGLPVGAEFEIRDAQNYFGHPVVSGVYTGASVVIPMTGLTVDPPVGQIPITPTHTAPEFGAFILVRSSGTVAPTGPTATFTGSPSSIAAGQSATLSWSTGNATSVVINQGIGAVPMTGSRTVTPSTTTTYTLTATNASGTVSRPVTIQVQNAAPIVSVSASGTSFTAPAAITLTANASDPGGSIKHVKFFAGSTELATDSTAPYSYLWTNVLAGTYVVTARATDNLDATTTSGAFNLTVGGGSTTPPPSTGTASASFVRLDTTTQGSWKGVYGAEGYSIAQDQALLSSYARVTRAGATGWTWSASTSDVRAVQRATGTGRLAATWFGSSFTMDVTITDGQRHQVALYLLDWDRNNRSETVDVLDAATNAVLHRIAVSSFDGGKYAVWQITGNVRFKITRTGGANGAVSGIFFGGGTGQTVPPTPPTPPTVGAASATFLRTDTTTHGNWKGMYGAEGYSLAQAENSKPNYANVTIPGGLPYTWSASTSDTRALQRASGTDRLAATWFSSSFAVDVAMTDGQSHQIALYFLDWDHNNRAETIEVLDAATNAVLDTRVVSSFDGGQYFVWLAKGNLRFRITGKNGANAVVSGVFFGGG